jgi:beta-galactosidase GanA
VFVPSPAIINDSHADNWRKYVNKGGNLVVMFRAFFKTQGSTWTDQPHPAGKLGDLLGVSVDEFFSVPPVPSVGMRRRGDTGMDWNDERGTFALEVSGGAVGFGLPTATRARYHTWAEVLKANSAEAIMHYGDGYYKEGVAAAAHKVGKGTAYTVGFWGEQVIPRSIYTALDLKRFEIAERDSHGTVEVVKMEDKSGNAVEIRLNHFRHSVSLPELAK